MKLSFIFNLLSISKVLATEQLIESYKSQKQTRQRLILIHESDIRNGNLKASAYRNIGDSANANLEEQKVQSAITYKGYCEDEINRYESEIRRLEQKLKEETKRKEDEMKRQQEEKKK